MFDAYERLKAFFTPYFLQSRINSKYVSNIRLYLYDTKMSENSAWNGFYHFESQSLWKSCVLRHSFTGMQSERLIGFYDILCCQNSIRQRKLGWNIYATKEMASGTTHLPRNVQWPFLVASWVWTSPLIQLQNLTISFNKLLYT